MPISRYYLQVRIVKNFHFIITVHPHQTKFRITYSNYLFYSSRFTTIQNTSTSAIENFYNLFTDF
jgi:hypothetical protein